MKLRHNLLLLFSLLLISAGAVFAQNQDSVKAYIAEMIEPDPNFVLTYGTASMSLEYIEHDPLSPLSEDFINEQKAKYELSGDPMTLYIIAQTYRRMNRRRESAEWTEKALLKTESLMGKYPDSIELVETAFLIYLDNGQTDLACIAAKMVSDHYKNSKSLLTEAVTYTFTGQHDLGLQIANKGLELYPNEAEWYMMRIVHEFSKKMSTLGLNTDAFFAEENRIDPSYLDQGFANHPDNPEIELVSVVGNFFLYAYEQVIPKFYKQISDDMEIEGFKFDLDETILTDLNAHLQKVQKLSKRKEFKNWHSIYYTLGMIHMFRSEPEEAIRHFEKAIDLMKPEYRQAQDNVYHYYDNMIVCHRILGDFASAEECAIKKATEEINLDPVPAHYVEMAQYRAAEKDFDAALNLLDQAFAMDSTVIDVYTNKALILMLTDRTDEAFDYFTKAELVEANDLFTYKAVVLYRILEKNSDAALSLIKNLEAYDPTDGFIADARRLLKTN